jgi:hypothetical protein
MDARLHAMRPREVELWALAAVEACLAGGREDARVEFKRELPNKPKELARKLAGHANTARGEFVLWVIGVDEATKTLHPARLPDEQDGADWWPQIWRLFDGDTHPELIDVSFEFNGTRLLALAFGCDRTPYVVKTGVEGVTLEVPWRQGTRVQSATRSQLLRMMLPEARTPTVEVISSKFEANELLVTFFVTPKSNAPLLLLQERTRLLRADRSAKPFTMQPSWGPKDGGAHPGAVRTEEGLYFSAPAYAHITWKGRALDPPQPCRARLAFEPGGIEVLVSENMPSI